MHQMNGEVGKRGRLRTLLPTAVAIIWLATTPALAQLTPDDIQNLRGLGLQEGWTFAVGENEATQYSIEQLCGLVEPADEVEAPEYFDPHGAPPLGLPVAFDWRDFNGCTPIRNQAGCGSCWAFGAIASVECTILINEGVSVDLSEQWLVSCTDSGSCSGGWHYKANRYLKEVSSFVDPCGDSGAVLEADFPYVASDVPCNCPYPHPYAIQSWGQVGANYPEVDQVKQALLQYGPLSTTVYVNGAFQGYNSGVFNACNNDESVNHCVAIVGWDDTQGANGVWIIRNSWGPGWGEGGYMRIEYGCSRIGYKTCYVDYHINDCNGNGIDDAEDIDNGFSEDCNFNGRPDDCDIAYGVSPDGNGNMVPDECDSCIMDKLVNVDAATGDDFAASVAICGPLAVAGASGDDTLGEDAGAAYVFRYNGLQWLPEAQLLASDGQADDGFGVGVGVHGDQIVVGADYDDDLGDNSGAAFVFVRDDDEWIQQAKLLPSDGAENDLFGRSVAIFEDVVIVGAYRDDDAGSDSGSAYIFRYDGSSWSQEAKLVAPDGAASDIFGFSVDVCDGLAIVGANWNDEAALNAGAAYIFRYDGSEWSFDAKLMASDAVADDFFGWSVSVSHDVAVAGASYADPNGLKSGAAYVYRFDPDALSWVEAKLMPSDGSAYDRFGHSVAIDNDVIVVGAYGDADNGANAGSAYAFRYDGTDWIQQAKFLALDGNEEDKFGQSVATSGDSTIIGAYWSDDVAEEAGAAYLFAGLLGLDCNDNGELDACDIADGVAVDCNANGAPDACDLDEGISQDCNLNGAPDECDIAAGDAEDCNLNGIPDSCDIDNQTSQDANGNGIPDECECPADLNTDQVVDINDLFAILDAWGPCDDPEDCPEDIDSDGVVDINDVFELFGAWGPCD